MAELAQELFEEPEDRKRGFVDSLLSVFSPSEAEAFPIGKLIKSGTKAAGERMSGIASSTTDRLIGTQFKGKAIKNVTKGAQDWRYVELEDGSVYPVTKDVLHDLSRAAGTVSQLSKFSSGDEPSQLLQAMKSLQFHKQRSVPAASKPLMRDYYKRWQATMKEAGSEAPASVMVQHGNDVFTMPTAYAKLLQAEGQIKILKELK